MKLSCLSDGESAAIKEILCENDLKYRLIDMGLIENSRVTCLMRSLGCESAAYLIGDCVIAIRREDADNINVKA